MQCFLSGKIGGDGKSCKEIQRLHVTYVIELDGLNKPCCYKGAGSIKHKERGVLIFCSLHIFKGEQRAGNALRCSHYGMHASDYLHTAHAYAYA